MPQEIGNTIIYCYTTGEYVDGSDGYTSFCVKYKKKVYNYASLNKWFLKVLHLMDKGKSSAFDNVQFDDIKLMKLFLKLFEIELNGYYHFKPNKNRVPHYLYNILGEMRITKGTLQLWKNGDPTISYNRGRYVYKKGKVEIMFHNTVEFLKAYNKFPFYYSMDKSAHVISIKVFGKVDADFTHTIVTRTQENNQPVIYNIKTSKLVLQNDTDANFVYHEVSYEVGPEIFEENYNNASK